MKNAWPEDSLENLCKFVRGPFGGSLKKDIFISKGFAVYEQQHAIYNQFDDIRYFIDNTKFQEMQRFELKPNDLIMSCSGTMGKIAIVPADIKPGIINQALLKITPSDRILPVFLKYWMCSNYFQNSLMEQSGGAAIQNVASVNIIKKIKIRLPPLPEQRRIVAILDEAFAGLETMRVNAETCYYNSSEIFRGKLNEIFSSNSSNSTEKPLGEVCNLQNGYAFKSNDYVSFSNTLNIRMSSIRPDGSFEAEHNKRFLPDEYANIYSAFLLKEGDLIIAMTDMAGDPKILGVPTLVKDLKKRSFLMNQRVGKLCDFSSNIHIPYLRYFLTSPSLKEYYKSKGAGGLQINISKKDVLSAKIPIKPLEEQILIANLLDNLMDETNSLADLYEKKLEFISELKQSILHKAFSGELNLSDIAA